jgi:hypothetical protein
MYGIAEKRFIYRCLLSQLLGRHELHSKTITEEWMKFSMVYTEYIWYGYYITDLLETI